MTKANCSILYYLGVWSKPIANTDGAEIVDIHTIRLARPSYAVINMNADIGTVLHYRALAHNSTVLKQSRQYNVLKRNTHLYMDQAKQSMSDICSFNNPVIGDVKFAD